ncbi:hypothetical protein QA648_35205 (plasmid) [Rhizobium sp. CB3171]|uniref:hypothetical protein n=1 Tax=Rhizobium sp. CB3171 TaxID=3039157 RepID=UPI0024B0593D|nr:hypothetical protein [Rhizobium sp. CB3171]WFU07156.1 hypothetical protein QA648_35205 [Rhizobium sp. CB3171]
MARNIKDISHLLGNYGLSTFATAAVSGSHLLVQLAVLHSLGNAEFGLVAFMLTLMQFGSGLCNSMVAAPFTVLINTDRSAQSAEGLFLINAGLALCNAAVAVLTVFWLGTATVGTALAFAASSALFTVRWFARTEAYAMHNPVRAALSDVVYAAVLLTCLAIAWFYGMSLSEAAGLFAIAGCAGMLPFGKAFLVKHFRVSLQSALASYGPVWRDQARWAVAGLVTTEATSNAHAYIVTSVAGPAAFAPIAAAMLFLRPIGVCMVSLTQIERPAMARALSTGNRAGALRYVARFMAVLGFMWLSTIVAVACIVHFFPALAFKPGLDANLILISFVLWAAVCLVQCVQTPLNVFLQAEGRFRELAGASIKSSLLTLVAVPMLLVVVGPIYSTIGVMLGQIVMTLGIVVSVRRSRYGEAINPATAQAEAR